VHAYRSSNLAVAPAHATIVLNLLSKIDFVGVFAILRGINKDVKQIFIFGLRNPVPQAHYSTSYRAGFFALWQRAILPDEVQAVVEGHGYILLLLRWM